MNISGTWYNELNSSMTLVQNGDSITGTYQTPVGGAQGTYQLTGVINDSGDASPTIAWTVAWVNEYGNLLSVTAWCGHMQASNSIVTMWLLSSETTPEKEWSSTQVGQDVFYLQVQSDQVVAAAIAKGHFSHPKK